MAAAWSSAAAVDEVHALAELYPTQLWFDPGSAVHVQLAKLKEETRCPICFGRIRNTRVSMACLHRYCASCIEQYLRAKLPGRPADEKKECPVCRARLSSRRATKPDHSFDVLVQALYGDVEVYEAAEEALIKQECAARTAEWQAQMAQLRELQAQHARDALPARGGSGGGGKAPTAAGEKPACALNPPSSCTTERASPAAAHPPRAAAPSKRAIGARGGGGGGGDGQPRPAKAPHPPWLDPPGDERATALPAAARAAPGVTAAGAAAGALPPPPPVKRPVHGARRSAAPAPAVGGSAAGPGAPGCEAGAAGRQAGGGSPVPGPAASSPRGPGDSVERRAVPMSVQAARQLAQQLLAAAGLAAPQAPRPTVVVHVLPAQQPEAGAACASCHAPPQDPGAGDAGGGAPPGYPHRQQLPTPFLSCPADMTVLGLRRLLAVRLGLLPGSLGSCVGATPQPAACRVRLRPAANLSHSPNGAGGLFALPWLEDGAAVGRLMRHLPGATQLVLEYDIL